MPPPLRHDDQAAVGDFQTPRRFATLVCDLLARVGVAPAAVVEPTCGKGSLLAAAEGAFTLCETFRGYEINPSHVRSALTATHTAHVFCRDFFNVRWDAEIASLDEPVLILANPPWATAAAISAAHAANPAPRSNAGLRGLDAVTGDSNFDISEPMMVQLAQALSGRRGTLAVLCKTSVARRVLRRAWADGLQISDASLYRIDARSVFAAAADACLLVCHMNPDASSTRCAVYSSLNADQPASVFGMLSGRMVADISGSGQSLHLLGDSPLRWRSGVKHDCAPVFELRPGPTPGIWLNGLGEAADLEPHRLYPLMKGSDLIHGTSPSRSVLMTQNAIGEDTAHLADNAPRVWRYLQAHSGRLDARASRVYANRPRFCVFGVGAYSFAPWKVAICGFAKRLQFRCVAPQQRRPVILDDTCYLLGCASRADAETLQALMMSPPVQQTLEALIFWDAKRPITARLLNSVNLGRAAEDAGVRLPRAFEPSPGGSSGLLRS